MPPVRIEERGEGKIGCIASLLVLILGIGIAAKLLPVYYSNSNFTDAAGEIATRAGVLSIPELKLQLRDKAKELNIPEALAEGAIAITASGQTTGVCTIKLKYSRTVDLYGVYTLTLDSHKTIIKSYIDAR